MSYSTYGRRRLNQDSPNPTLPSSAAPNNNPATYNASERYDMTSPAIASFLPREFISLAFFKPMCPSTIPPMVVKGARHPVKQRNPAVKLQNHVTMPSTMLQVASSFFWGTGIRGWTYGPAPAEAPAYGLKSCELSDSALGVPESTTVSGESSTAHDIDSAIESILSSVSWSRTVSAGHARVTGG